MGLPIARNLLKAGFEVTGVDLSAERRQLFAAAGGAVSDDAGDASKGADLAVTILMSDLIVEQAALGAGGVLASLPVGAALCDLSTTSPKTAEHLRNAAFSTGRQFICAKVVGSVGLAESAGLTVCASGPRSLFDACDPVFSAMSSQAYYLGKAEEAAYLKLVHSLIVGIYSSMIGEALAFGRKGGLSLATMLDILEAGPLGSRQLTLKAPVLRERRFEAPPSDIDTAAKDMDLILDAARAISAPLPLSATVRQLMGAAQANGKGKRDIYAILETFEDLGGLDHA
jgi:2-hydroxy-3-oxopropionate reductase